MKTSFCFTLLSLIAVAYGATVTAPVSQHKPVLSREAEAAVVIKAGKNLENIGRLLQGEVALTKENQGQVVEALSTLAAGEGALGDEEHILPIIVRGVVQGAIAHGVKKWLDKRG